MIHADISLATCRRLSVLAGIALCCFMLSACLGLTGGSKLPPPSTPLVGEARQAWDSGDMRKAENLYGRAVKLTLPQAEQRESWERLALSTARNGRPNSALDALGKWNKADPAAHTLPEWQDAWFLSARTLPPSESIKKASALWKNKKYDADARAQAALILLGRTWGAESILAAQPVLATHYNNLSPQRKKTLEQRTSEEVRYMSSPHLAAVAPKLAKQSPLTFPASVLLLEQARRGLTVEGVNQSDLLTRLAAPTVFADAELPRRVLGGPAASTGSATAAAAGSGSSAGPAPAYKSVCLALALPASGPIGPIADKIRAGANAAKNELAALGVAVDLRTIDAAQGDWLAQIDALPPQCAVVGGPIQAPLYTAAKAAQATSRRHFFAFLPQLEGRDEGSTAWRFFPSPQDQVAALLRFTKQDLGITSYGAFYPSDAYGARMSAIFDQAVRQGGGSVHAVSYPPAEVSQWTKAAATLLNPRVINKVPLSTAEFGAVFLPDSWKNMDMVTTALLYNGDDKQVLLGTSLWEQSLMSGNTTANTANYALAVFPGAWNPAQIPPALGSLPSKDLWVGLGYDFVRFGASLGVEGHTNPTDINGRLQTAQRMTWSMAPILWSAGGQASQQLFLFTPGPSGIVQLNPAEFKEKLQEYRTRFENRTRAATAPQAQ